MAKRTYGQHCGLAVGLDLLAERWAMLVIRELMPGGRRFNDLFESLPGVSTDLLTARLRSLEEAGVIERVTIRHPAKVTLYQLTEWGQELRPIVEQLALWGVRLLPEPGHPDYKMSFRSALLSVAAAYDGGLDDGNYWFAIDDDDLTITIHGSNAQLYYGPPIGTVKVHLSASSNEMLEFIMSGGNDLAGVELRVGDLSTLQELLAWIPASQVSVGDEPLRE